MAAGAHKKAERAERGRWLKRDGGSGILAEMFSEAVLDHFKNPRNVGELANASASVEVTNPVCGDVLRLSVRVAGGKVAEARFKTRGCVTAIACSSWLAEWMEGKSLDELRRLTADHISQALGGLPPATVHGSQLAFDAVKALLGKFGQGA